MSDELIQLVKWYGQSCASNAVNPHNTTLINRRDQYLKEIYAALAASDQQSAEDHRPCWKTIHEISNRYDTLVIGIVLCGYFHRLGQQAVAVPDAALRNAEIARILDAMESVAGPGAPYASASVPRYAVLGWAEQLRDLLAASKGGE